MGIAESGNVLAACREAKVSRQVAYRYRASHPGFAAEWDAAMEDAIDLLEGIARRRAQTTSDVLLIFLLKGIRPEKFRERVEHSGKGTSFVMMFERPLADPLRDDETVLDVAALPPAEDDKTA